MAGVIPLMPNEGVTERVLSLPVIARQKSHSTFQDRFVVNWHKMTVDFFTDCDP